MTVPEAVFKLRLHIFITYERLFHEYAPSFCF